MSGGKYVDSEGHLYTVPAREQGNIYKPNNKTMADEMNEKQVYDVHTKEIDLVNRDPKHLNDDVVKMSVPNEIRRLISRQLSSSVTGSGFPMAYVKGKLVHLSSFSVNKLRLQSTSLIIQGQD